MTDEDLGARGQPAVVGGEHDAERRHGGARVTRVVGDRRLRRLLERDRVAPVGEREALVRRGGDGRAQQDEVRHRRSGRVGRLGATPSRGPRRCRR